MAALAEGLPPAVGSRLAAFQDAIHNQRPINQPVSPPSVSDPQLGKRKREGDASYDEELERDRYLNDMKLKSRFEHIFSKYGKDFTDVGDEVDLFTGEVVIDNGHLQHMRTDLDLGGDHHGRLSEMLDADSSDTDGELYNKLWDRHDQQQVEEGDEENDLATEQDELGELEGTTDEEDADDFEDEQEQSDGDISTMSEDDYVADNDDGDAGTKSVEKDVWNDAPRLPGDVGYDPFANSNGQPGISGTALKEFESGVSDQITQLVDALQKAQDPAHLRAQADAGLKPQITIDLDPTSASYGKPVITYIPIEGQKRNPAPAAAASGFFAELQRQSDLPAAEEVMKRPRDIAANVLTRIADAGLPTVPGPDGKFPPYRGKKSDQSGRNTTASISGGNADTVGTDQTAIPIDPALEAATASEMQAEVAAASDLTNRDTPDTEYSANTARPLGKKLLPPGVPFSEEDDELILELKDNRSMVWEDIRDLCFPDRRVTALQYRYYTYLKSDCRNDFTEEDDRLIVKLREEDCMSWPWIQRNYFSEFRINQLQYRYYTKLCRVRKTQWTPEQDQLLADLKDQQGLTWQQIKDQHFPKRTVGQIQYRYYKTGRPADWKEQLVALTQAYEQPNADGDQDWTLTASGLRPAAEGTLIWGVRRRLAAASSNLTEKKRQHFAEKRKKREEKKRLESSRLQAQEEKRNRREAQNIAKLNSIRAEQDDARSKSRIGRRDIASLSPEPDAIEETPPGPDPELLAIEREVHQQNIKQQFEEAITNYQENEEQQRMMNRRISGRVYEAEEKRQDDRKLFQQAVQIGPMLLPKPASKPPTSGITPGSIYSAGEQSRCRDRSYVSPYPCALPDDVQQPTLGTVQPIDPALSPMDPQILAPSPSLPMAANSASPSVAALGPSLPGPTTERASRQATMEMSRSTSCDSLLNKHTLTPAPQPAQQQGPTGPISRQWSLPKLQASLARKPTSNAASKSDSDRKKTTRRPARVAVPFPSRSPVREHAVPHYKRVKDVRPSPTATSPITLTSNTNDVQDTRMVTPDVDSCTVDTIASGPVEPLVVSSLVASIPDSVSQQATAVIAESITNAAHGNSAEVFYEAPKDTLPAPLVRPEVAEVSSSKSPHEAVPDVPTSVPVEALVPHHELVKSRTTFGFKATARGRRTSRRVDVVSDSESDAPSSIDLLSNDDDDDSSIQEISDSDLEDDSFQENSKQIDRSAPGAESDDELIGHRDLLDSRVLGMRASMSSVERRSPQTSTPQKQTPQKGDRRRSAPAKTLRALMAATPKMGGVANPGSDDDELA